jgi:hypothetical protein
MKINIVSYKDTKITKEIYKKVKETEMKNRQVNEWTREQRINYQLTIVSYQLSIKYSLNKYKEKLS